MNGIIIYELTYNKYVLIVYQKELLPKVFLNIETNVTVFYILVFLIKIYE